MMCENLEWKKLPTEPGWYWYKEREPIGIAPQVVVSVANVYTAHLTMGDELRVSNGWHDVPVKQFQQLEIDLLWMGPIQKPPVEEGYPILQDGYGLYFREKVT